MRENMGMHRGKRVDTGEWIYGYYVKSEYYEGGYTHFIIELNSKYDDYDSFYLMYPVDPDTVGADTGLPDKNGKRIYEGDVVSTQFGRLCKVRWFSSPGYCGWDLTPVESWNHPPMKSDLFAQKNLTVIGNKWDNPELLK